MKLRYRLIISFVISAIVPIIMLISVTSGVFESGLEFGVAPNASPEIVRQQMMDIIISGTIILALTSTLLIVWTYHGVVSKISIIIDAAKEIQEGNLDKPIEIKGNDELAQVAVAIEEMRNHLKSDAKERLEVERTQRQLVSNIAHDLKTPLTAIKGWSETLMDIDDTETRKKGMQIIGKETGRLSESRLNESVMRILCMKEAIGLLPDQ